MFCACGAKEEEDANGMESRPASGLDLSARWSVLELAKQKITSTIKERELERTTGKRREK